MPVNGSTLPVRTEHGGTGVNQQMAVTWLWQSTGEALHVSLAAGTLTFSFAGRSNFSFDHSGRLVGAWFDRITYRRALDNRVLAKWREGCGIGTRARRLLALPERRHVIERAYADADRVRRGLMDGSLIVSDDAGEPVQAVARHLDDIHSWNWDRLEADATRFHQIYKPVSILPPDQYLSLVLQATEGCSYNQCSFCTFYRDRPFRIKTESEFTTHIDQVRAFFGAGITMRRSVFLADANAVVIAQHKLIPLLQIANVALPFRPRPDRTKQRTLHTKQNEQQFDGIYAFISAPDALHKTPQDFATMRMYNVRRLYVGLETAHDPLRSFLMKQGSAADVLAAVRQIKAGGVSVGLIFMVGIGGQTYREKHFRDTIRLVQQMPLTAGGPRLRIALRRNTGLTLFGCHASCRVC